MTADQSVGTFKWVAHAPSIAEPPGICPGERTELGSAETFQLGSGTALKSQPTSMNPAGIDAKRNPSAAHVACNKCGEHSKTPGYIVWPPSGPQLRYTSPSDPREP
ncbi:hypothetical protein NDU88_005147 [Pleurodeles waltl]|uniref:Uncharacterized protein n=1 Tax=Pleurodeles waltl TaxID=8319 RepID=A0AAV7NVS1_PLEWA|nr:hypothetical protein NDU88_005147 [Pleurodeles waltl]